jgi:oligoribonuclease
MPQQPTKKEYFIWIDIETSGLDPTKDKILEIAVIITNLKLKEKIRYHTLVSDGPITEPYVLDMHTKSGLKAELDAVYVFKSPQTIQKELIKLLEIINPDGMYYFAGSSVHFDVEFIAINYPKFAAKVSYRILDISSLILAKRIRRPKFNGKKHVRGTVHRAQDDIRNSLNFAKKYYGRKFWQFW